MVRFITKKIKYDNSFYSEDDKKFIETKLVDKFYELYDDLEKFKSEIILKINSEKIITDVDDIYFFIDSKSNNMNFKNFVEFIKDDEIVSIEIEKYIDTIFLNFDLETIKIIEKLEFEGIIVVNDENISFKYILEKDKRYDEKIEKILYSSYNSNIYIKEISNRLFNRLYRIKIVDIEKEIFENINNLDILYNFGVFEKNIINNVIVYSNIFSEILISNSNIYPSEEKSLINHTVYIDNNTYLVSDEINIYLMYKKYEDEVYTLNFINEYENKNIYNFFVIKKINLIELNYIKNKEYITNKYEYNLNKITEFTLKKYIKNHYIYSKVFKFNNIDYENKKINLYLLKKDIYYLDNLKEISNMIYEKSGIEVNLDDYNK